MKLTAFFVLLAGVLALGGCGSSGQSPTSYTQAELNAIETRDVDADMQKTFDAASGALFDAGYTIAMSDRSAGLLTGQKGKDNTAARIWISPFITDTRYVISVQLKSISAVQTAVRVKASINGEPIVDKSAIDQIWVLMQRQVMMKEPPRPAPPATPNSK